MKNLFLILLSLYLVLSCTGKPQAQASHAATVAHEITAAEPTAEISFNFTRQSGSASNQYAIWIEDANGQYVKTLYASRWTADGGYSRRPTSIPMWIQKSNRANMSREQVNAVSGATPRTESVTYTWDGTDFNGAVVQAGDYTLILEGTLRWENQVYYRSPIALGGGITDSIVSVEYVSGDRDTTAERAMISDVRVRVLR